MNRQLTTYQTVGFCFVLTKQPGYLLKITGLLL